MQVIEKQDRNSPALWPETTALVDFGHPAN